MENAVFTTLCMVYDDRNRILVQERHGTNWDGLAFPGGHVEAGESFTKSVIREVYEETGYQIKNPVLCGIKQFQLENGARYVILLRQTGSTAFCMHHRRAAYFGWTEKICCVPIWRMIWPP